MAIAPAPLVAGPEPVARRYGLLTAASGPLDLPERGRGSGVRYVPVTCGGAHPYPIACYDGAVAGPIGDAFDPDLADPENELVETGVFGVVASLPCGSVGYTTAEFEEKIRRRLLNGEQGAAELALWTGLDPDGVSLDILSLDTDPATVTVLDPLSIVSAVAALEDYAYRDQGYGNVAYIHAPVSVAAYAADHGLVVDERNIKRTPFGSVWVFGGGYPGTGAAGAAPPAGGAYLHITGQIQVWRSPDILVYPVDQTMNRTTNQRFLVAVREFAIGFDCLNGRALFNPEGAS